MILILQDIETYNELPVILYPNKILSYITAKNIQHHLQVIGRLLFQKADYSSRINKRFEIRFALENCCANYKDDLKKMINSIMNRH